MHTTVRIMLAAAAAPLLFALCGCRMAPAQALHQTQLQAMDLYRQAQALSASQQQLAAEKERLKRQANSLRSSLEIANKRIENLKSGLSEAQQRYVSLLSQARNQKSPLSDSATRRFQDLVDKYPGFEFDPHTGVSKFHADILFASGSDRLKNSALPLLKEFASIMNEGDAKRLNILVVGHTDDRPIVKRSTASKHPTNWHLSTNRANSVVLALSKAGIAENRMGAAGYSKYQPVAPNADEKSRALNRRVEIYVLAPDAIVAGWDSDTNR